MILEARASHCYDCRKQTSHEAFGKLWKCPCGKIRAISIDTTEDVSHSGDARRFWSKVKKTAHCWVWLGKTQDRGNFQVWFEGRPRSTHRVAFYLTRGRWPKGLALRTCSVKWCVNPSHVIEGHSAGFFMRLNKTNAKSREKVCRKNFHPMTPENTIIRKASGDHRCRTCYNTNRRNYWHRLLGPRRAEKRRAIRIQEAAK